MCNEPSHVAASWRGVDILEGVRAGCIWCPWCKWSYFPARSMNDGSIARNSPPPLQEEPMLTVREQQKGRWARRMTYVFEMCQGSNGNKLSSHASAHRSDQGNIQRLIANSLGSSSDSSTKDTALDRHLDGNSTLSCRRLVAIDANRAQMRQIVQVSLAAIAKGRVFLHDGSIASDCCFRIVERVNFSFECSGCALLPVLTLTVLV